MNEATRQEWDRGRPHIWTIRWARVVSHILKVMAWLEFLAGLGYALTVALNINHIFDGLTEGQRNSAAGGIAFGGAVLASLWAWLAYMLEAQIGIWRGTFLR